MTAIDLAFMFFIISFLGKIFIDFIENDKKCAEEARIRTTRQAKISPDAIRTINNYYKKPANAKRAVRTSLRPAAKKATPIKAVKSAI